MKRLVSILASSLPLTCTAIAKDVPATEKKIADFEADLGQAMIHKDIATLSKLVGERLDYPKRQRRDGHKSRVHQRCAVQGACRHQLQASRPSHPRDRQCSFRA